MLLTLTDHLTCPGCGPSAGLILLMEHAAERRVAAGALGCPVCRVQYPIVEGVADLRGVAGGGAGGRGDDAAAEEASPPDVDAVRVAALMGLGSGGGFVLLDGPGAVPAAAGVAAAAAEYEVVVSVGGSRPGPWPDGAVSVLLDAGSIPVRSGAMRAVAYVGGAPGEGRLEELVRVCRPTGRLVVDLAGPDVALLEEVVARVDAAGAALRARDERGLVAVVGRAP